MKACVLAAAVGNGGEGGTASGMTDAGRAEVTTNNHAESAPLPSKRSSGGGVRSAAGMHANLPRPFKETCLSSISLNIIWLPCYNLSVRVVLPQHPVLQSQAAHGEEV